MGIFRRNFCASSSKSFPMMRWLVLIGVTLANGALLAPKGIVVKHTLAMARLPVAVMGVEDVASKCIEEGCPVDLLDDLLDELKAESSALTKRQQTLLILIGRLQALAGMDNPEKAEIEKIVLAASRSFSVVENFDFPGEALGYSLKPSKGNEKLLK